MRDGLVVGEEQVRDSHLIQSSGYPSAQSAAGRKGPEAGEGWPGEASL